MNCIKCVRYWGDSDIKVAFQGVVGGVILIFPVEISAVDCVLYE